MPFSMSSLAPLWRKLRFHTCFVLCTLVMSGCSVIMDRFGWYRLRPYIQWGFGMGGILGAGVPIKTELAKMPPPGPQIIMANHTSTLDICLFFTQMPWHDCCFVAKKPLFKIPIFGTAMKALGHVCVDQDNPRQSMKAIDEAIQKARDGRTIVIFPEGTRAHTFETLQEFQVGAMILALKSGLPVTPVLVHGAGEVYGRETSEINAPIGPMRLTALDTINPCEEYGLRKREALRMDLQRLMTSEYERLRAEYYPALTQTLPPKETQ